MKAFHRIVAIITALILTPHLARAATANEVYITQRNSANTSNTQRAVQAAPNRLIGFDASSIATYRTVTDLLPSQSGNSGKLLGTDGSGNLSWNTVSGTGVAASSSETLTGTNSTSFVTPAGMRSVTTAGLMRTTRAGVAFDGTSSAKVQSTLTGQSITTDPFSIVVVFRVPESIANDVDVVVVGPNATSLTTPDVVLGMRASDGALLANFRTPTDTLVTVPSFLTNHAGRVVIAIVTRSSSGATIYVNGTSVATSSASGVLGSITSTYLTLSSPATSRALTTPVYSVSLYNLALSAAEAVELYETGGAVPYRYQFGSQTPTMAGDFSVGADSWSGTQTTASGNIDGINGVDDTLRAYASNTVTAHTIGRSVTNARDKVYRFTAQVYVPTANTNVQAWHFFMDGNGSGATSWTNVNSGLTAFSKSASWQTCDVVLRTHTTFSGVTFYGHNGSTFTFAGANSVTDDLIYIKSPTWRQLGAVVHLPLNEGAGLTAYDASTNGLNGTLSSTGVAHIAPQKAIVLGNMTASTSLVPTSSGGLTITPASGQSVAVSGGFSASGTLVQGTASLSGSAVGGFKSSTGPQITVYSDVAAGNVGTSGINADTYGSAKYAGFSIAGTRGVWGFSSDSDTYLTTTVASALKVGSFSAAPHTNASTTFTSYGTWSGSGIATSGGLTASHSTSATLVLNQTGTRQWTMAATGGNLDISAGSPGGTVNFGTNAGNLVATGNITVSGPGTNTFAANYGTTTPLVIQNTGASKKASIGYGDSVGVRWNVGQDVSNSGLLHYEIVRNTGVALRAQDGSYTTTPVLDITATGTSTNGTSTVKGVRTGTTTWDPSSIADGAVGTATVTVTGAVVGDLVTASLTSVTTQDVLISAHIQAANTARVVLMNKTGAPLDLASGTLRVMVTSF